MVPLLTLGIPGDGVTAILLGGLMIHDIQPGPSMYLEQYPIIIGIFTCMLVCTLILKLGVDIVMSQMASGQVSPAMRIPMWVIYGAIPMGMAFCVIRYIVEIYHSVKNFNKPEDREVLE